MKEYIIPGMILYVNLCIVELALYHAYIGLKFIL